MIKLNNKKITYVALADSSNSLKAPKEIWYADSANSVKLVYRRKDALIEGEDYEKYHWVKGYGDAYIDTNIKVSSDDVINIKFIPISLPDSSFIVFGDDSGNWNHTSLVLFYNYYLQLRPCVPNTALTRYTLNTIYEVQQTMASYIVNGQELWHGNSLFAPSNYNCCIFSSSTDHTKNFNGKIAKFSISSKINLIPCKLLKQVPKWLDANGIRRQVGECGMIDLVSGKFYGNVNSVGTFTVENYYERKEWLVGDGSAYIDTLHLANEGLLWETHVSNLSFKKYFVWNRIVDIESPAISLYHSVATNGTVRVQNNYTNSIVLQNQTNYDYTVTINSNGAVINEVQYNGQSASENISNKSIKLFYCDIDASSAQSITNEGANSQDVCCAYFRFLDSNRDYIQNLIPCTLTMDLPASMDANNIARTKGTSGMWDLVSDRFYGNVASSGIFKAVNLAEGVDYEVHDWLVVEINSVGTLQRLPINSSSMSYRVKRINGQNLHFFRTDGYDYYYRTENFHLGIYDLNQKKLVYNTSSIIDNEIDFECSAGNVSANGVDIPIYGFPIKEVRFHASDSGGMETYTSSITVDGIERYIPVKLLKSIPSKYDANGITRQAGECGMYDTVNDKFYGNVASSGTFTVEDN